MKKFSVQRDKLANENNDLKSSIKEEEVKHQLSKNEIKEKEMLISALKAQYEASTEGLKKQLDQLKNENEKQLNHLKEIETEKR